MFMVACSSEETQVDPSISPTRGESDVTIRLTFPASGSYATRAITDADEHKITSIDLIVFIKDANNNLLDDKYAYKIHVPESDINNQSSATKSISVNLQNMPSDQQRILLLANIPAALRASAIETLTDGDVGVTTEQEIVNRLRFSGAPWQMELTSGTHTPFPMFGQMVNYMPIDHDHPVTTPITINMIRSMARIDVKVDASASTFGSDFSINKIYLYNASDSGYVAPHNDYISQAPEITTIGKTNPSSQRTTTGVEYTFPPLTNRELIRSIYVPESDSLIVNGLDSIKPAYLVLDAQYKGNRRFYRVDFTQNANFIPILRNHNYVINILGIKAEGFQTLTEAMTAPLTTLNFFVSIEGANSEINDVTTYNDQYLLGLSVNEVIFDWDQNWIGRPVNGNAYYTARVYSTYNNGEWSVVSASAGFTAQKEDATKLRITANNKNYTGSEITPGKVVIKAGLITKEITVRQTGGANSVVANFPTGLLVATVRIPLGFLAAAKPNIFDGKSISDFKDSILWHEGNLDVSFTSTMSTGSPIGQQYITVTATATSTSEKYANAVVAITWKDKDGIAPVGGYDPDEIVWSWHIWAMPENGTTGYSSGGNVNSDFHNPNMPLLMKRVLGKGVAGHMGLHYQWGRKDPFFRSLNTIVPDIFYDPIVTVNDNKETAIRRPTTFFKGTPASDYDWRGTVHNEALWSELTATKTFYDPCPEGWRVPPRYADVQTSPWLNDVNIVRSEYSNGRMPSGNEAGATTGGYLWTATVTGNQAYYTSVPASGIITHTNTAERASGLSVRCVKDLERNY
jgi:hypothetical protein